jgi:hypothetical protein
MRERDERREREALERRLADEYSRRVAGIDPAVLASVGAKYRGDLELVHQQTDPRDFETEMRGWLSRVAYESNEVALQQRTQAMQAKRSASTAARAAQVRDASVSASGSVPAPPPQPRTIADLSVEELDSWLKTNVPRH